MHRTSLLAGLLTLATLIALTQPPARAVALGQRAPTSSVRAPASAGGTDAAILEEGVATLVLPDSLAYHSRAELIKSAPYMEQLDALGIIVPSDRPWDAEDTWWIIVDLRKDGHMPMAALPAAAEMTEGARDTAAVASKLRLEAGEEPLQFIDWALQPTLDTKRHVLRWGYAMKIGLAQSHQAMLYAHVFGRTETIHLSAEIDVASQAVVNLAMKSAAEGIAFAEGHTYAEFVEGHDQSVSYSLNDVVIGLPRIDTEAFIAELDFREGVIVIGNDIATLTLPEGYSYLGPDDAKRILIEAWGNPPETAEDTLGMIFPSTDPFADDGWGIAISFDESGYVDDDEARSLDFDDVLNTMKEAATSESKDRERRGYPAVEVIGWARDPEYAPVAHALIWSRELAFANHPLHGLNYDVRLLGREGTLVLNAIATMEEVSQVRAAMNAVPSFVAFNAGQRYEDYQPGTDRVSKAGLAALMLGGTSVAAKTGLFKGLLVALVAAKKLLLVGLVALAMGLKRLIGRRGKTGDSTMPDAAGHGDDGAVG